MHNLLHFQEVKDLFTGIIKMLDSGDVLKVDQTHVETVIPAIGELQQYTPMLAADSFFPIYSNNSDNTAAHCLTNICFCFCLHTCVYLHDLCSVCVV